MSAALNRRSEPDVRLNPHPSADPEYDVELVGEALEGLVEVRYIRHPEISWLVNDDVPDQWRIEDRL